VTQVSTGRARALKVLRPEMVDQPGLRERFLKEAQVSATFASDRVPDVVGAGVDDATKMPWIAMELLVGEDLASVMKRRGRLTPGEVAGVFGDLLDALGPAHDAGVIHMDLKPENIFVAKGARGAVCKVLDFGISRLVAETRRSVTVNDLIASPQWMAPEQAEKKARASAATDVWSLGLLAFHLLTGKFYWKDANVDPGEELNLLAVMTEVGMCRVVAPPPASVRARELGVGEWIPRGFDAWFARCVAQDRAQRYTNAREAVPALLEVLRASGHTAVVPEPAVGGRVSAVSSAPPSPPPVVSIPPTALMQGTPVVAAPTAPMIPAGSGIPPVGGVVGKGQGEGASRRETTVTRPPRSNWAGVVGGVLAGVLVTVAVVWWKGRDTRSGPSRVVAPRDAGAVVSVRVPVAAQDARASADVPHEPRCSAGMVRLRGGTLAMGSPAGQGEEDEHPQHRVEVEPFCLDPYEVTVARFREFWNAGHPLPQTNLRYPGGWEMRPQWVNEPGTGGSCTWSASAGSKEQHPINCIDWDTAQAYCGSVGGRLPSEAEWEFAARGTEGRKYPWGNTPEPDGTRANLYGRESNRQYGIRGWNDGFATTAPVGSFRAGATPDGIFDLAGNVWEWTADVYAPYGASQGALTVQSGSDITHRVIRGGSWYGGGVSVARGAFRNGCVTGDRYDGLGFRCARGVM